MKCWCLIAIVLAGCTGKVGEGQGPATPTRPGGNGNGNKGGNTGQAGGPDVPAPAGAPATGQRLTDRQYLNVITDLFAVDASADVLTMPLDPKLEGFRNAASALLPSDLRIEGYAAAARVIVGKVDWAQQLARAGVCADATAACRNDFFARIGRRLFRRPLTAEQIARFTPLFEAVAKEGDPFPVAAGLVATAMLQSPEFLYRLERAGGSVDDFELATRLSFLLWNSTPDDALLDAAAHGPLAGAALHAQVARLLADDRAHRALRDYVDDWLDADKLLRTSRDPMLFPQFSGALAADMREEIHRLFARVVWQDDADLVEVLRSQHTMVTPALARLYGLPPRTGDGFADQDLSQSPTRSGLLTQAGILTLTSVGGQGSSIVDRGLFVLRNFLCRTIPEPPSNVPDLPSADSGKSERDRLAQHRADPACGACHNQFDPLGIAFEAYDAIGAVQTMDQAGNRLTGAGSLTVEGQEVPYTNVREFVAALTKTSEVGSCLSRKVVQYAFARPLGSADEKMVTEIGARFAEGGHRYKGLMAGLAEGAWIHTAGSVAMKTFDRRQVLRGAGTIAIGLPLLPSRARAAAGPQRFVTFYFGNGMPPAYSAPGWQSPVLAPLAPHTSKIALLRGVANRSAPGGAGHPHARGSSAFAIGYGNPSVETAGGQSLDFAAYEAWKPPTSLSSLAASMWWWSEDIVRNTHSWQGKGRPNPGVTRPLALFTRIFGTPMPAAPVGSPEEARAMKQRRYDRSVLDSVLEGYKSVTGSASPYGPSVRATLSNHFEAVRSLERRAIAADKMGSGGGSCKVPAPPPDVSPQTTCSAGCDTKGSTGTHDAGGGVNKSSNWDQVWPLLVDLFVMALRCDATRIGNMTCTASGDRYTFAGQSKNVHDLAHGWRASAENGFDKSVTWLMGNLAYFLKAMDDPAFTLPEGGTLLDHTPVLIGTEVGDPAPHSFSSLTFMMAGGGLFKPGIYDFGDKSSEVDLYSTVSRALGIGDKFGDPRYFNGYLAGVV